MKVLAFVVAFAIMLALEAGGGYFAQAYILPRIGLHALTFAQVCTAVAIIAPFQLVSGVLRAFVED